MINLPKRCSTLTSKIINDNPWQLGNELAAVIKENWAKIDKLRVEYCLGVKKGYELAKKSS